MENNTIIKVAAIGFVGLILVPRTLGLIGRSVAGISNIVVKKKFDKKIKNGLKNGSIVEINGKYYDVVNIVEEA